MIDSSLVSMESFKEGRTIPRTRNNHGGVENKPDVPGVEMGTLRRLREFVPHGCNEVPAGLMEIEPAVDVAGVSINGVIATPLHRLPLTPFFITHHGGERTYGGGTSKEALRRAKEQSRKQNNHNRV